MKKIPEVCVVVPAFNEGTVISEVLIKLMELPYRIIVVDDGSSDNTAQVTMAFPVAVLRHICNLGQGAALQTGIKYALSFKETRFIVTFDSDGQHSIEDIPYFIKTLESGNYDVVLGSRFLRDGDVVNIPLRKRIVLGLALTFTKLVTGLRLTDTHNGLRAFTAEAAARLNITHNRMAHASEILSQIATLKLRYCEIPVTVVYTSYSMAKGQSVFNSLDIIWDLVTGKMR